MEKGVANLSGVQCLCVYELRCVRHDGLRTWPFVWLPRGAPDICVLVHEVECFTEGGCVIRVVVERSIGIALWASFIMGTARWGDVLGKVRPPSRSLVT